MKKQKEPELLQGYEFIKNQFAQHTIEQALPLLLCESTELDLQKAYEHLGMKE